MGRFHHIALAVLACLSLLLADTAHSNERSEQVFEQADQLTKEILDLGFDIFLFEESVFFQSGDQLVVFITDDTKRPTQPKHVVLKIDGKPFFERQFKLQESRAFATKGPYPIVHNYLAPGAHDLEATITSSTSKRPYTTTMRFFKGGQTKFIELQLNNKRKIGTSVWE